MENQVFMVIYDGKDNYFMTSGEWIGHHVFRCHEFTSEELDEAGYSIVSIHKTVEEARQAVAEAKDFLEYTKVIQEVFEPYVEKIEKL